MYFKSNSRSFKQAYGFNMARPLSVTFSGIYMVKNDFVMTCLSKGEIYSSGKSRDTVLFDWLNSYHT